MREVCFSCCSARCAGPSPRASGLSRSLAALAVPRPFSSRGPAPHASSAKDPGPLIGFHPWQSPTCGDLPPFPPILAVDELGPALTWPAGALAAELPYCSWWVMLQPSQKK
eukprot:2341444-Rhodomonas_salina.1